SAADGKPVLTCDAHAGPVLALDYHHLGYLATGGLDRRVRIWNPDNRGRLYHTFLGHSGPVWGVAFAPANSRQSVATAGGEVKLWNYQDDQEGRRLHANVNNWGPPSLSPTGRALFTWNNGRIIVLDLDGGWSNEELTQEQTQRQSGVGWRGDDCLALF